MTKTTIQYEVTIARRGQLTTTVKERTFPSPAALERWLNRAENQNNVRVLRYLDDRTQAQES